MTQGRTIDAKVLAIVEQALKIDPAQWKALAMAGAAAFDRKNYRQAIGYWEQLQQRAEPSSEFARTLAANIAEARQLGNLKPGAADNAAPAAGASVRGKVSLSPALASQADPSDIVFIFARAPQGPRIPLAIIRRHVKDLPFTFSLDDGQAMSPDLKLSQFAEVVVSARVSKSANAVPRSGDLQGSSKRVKVGADNVAVVIDSVVP
jgi:cytochrome c-type biogenesis protein CcmH